MDKQIVWYPGHMARATRKIKEDLPLVDMVIELLDARAPVSSRNPSFQDLFASKPCLTLLTKCSLADERATNRLIQQEKANGRTVLPIDCKTGRGIRAVAPAIRALMAEKLERYAAKGMKKSIRAMVVGITNVGKSTFINTVAGGKKAKAEDRPGVTRHNQWIPAPAMGVDLLDTPGVLWHKFEDQSVARKLAALGSIRDEILDQLELACALLGMLRGPYADLLQARYSFVWSDDETDYDLLLKLARKRGFLRSGGEVDEERAASVLLDEFRAGKIGGITLD